MNDLQAIKIARRIDAMNKKMSALMYELENHANGKAMIESLQSNGFDNPALATHCISDDLEMPEKWQCVNMKNGGLAKIRRTQRALDERNGAPLRSES